MSVQASTHLAVINPDEEVSTPAQRLEDACPLPSAGSRHGSATRPCPNPSPGPSTPGKVPLLTPRTTGVL